MPLPPDVDSALSLRVGVLTTVVEKTIDDVRPIDDEKRRLRVIFAFETDDESARSVALAVTRMAKHDLKLPPVEPGALALVCWHDRLISLLRDAGHEVPDWEDPGAGQMFAIFLVNGRCGRQTLVIDPALVEHHRALDAELNALPAEVMTACLEGAKMAESHPDAVRRRRDAIVVCACSDDRAWAIATALARQEGEPLERVPGMAMVVIRPHEDVARLAREAGYDVPDSPDPDVGMMRTFLFSGGRLVASPMRIEDEDVVERREQQGRDASAAFAASLLEKKRRNITRAVRLLLDDKKRLRDQIVVVFGSPTTMARAVYADLAALPENGDWPAALPDGVPVVAVSYESFLDAARRHGVQFEGIEATKLGTNQVRAATFTPTGVHLQRIESVPLARGGSA